MTGGEWWAFFGAVDDWHEAARERARDAVAYAFAVTPRERQERRERGLWHD